MDFRRPLSVVAPTLDGDVLAVLAGAEAAFSGRQVHRLVGHSSEEGVRKALERLRRQGVVHAETAGAARLYRLNRQHLAAPHIQALARLPQELVARLRESIAAWALPPTYVALFGSAVRGDAGTESDLDLFVLRPRGTAEDDPRWRDQVSALASGATAWTGNDARVLEYGEEELVHLVGKDQVLTEISRDGLSLAGSGKTLRQRRGSTRG